MSKLLIQDLYKVNEPGVQEQRFGTNTFELFNWSSLDLTSLIVNISIFIFLWNIFVSFFYISDFFYCYRIAGDDDFEVEKTGIDRLYGAIKIWLTTLPSILSIIGGLFLSQSRLVLFGLALFFYILKIVYDLRSFAKISVYFSWYTDIFVNLRKLRLK